MQRDVKILEKSRVFKKAIFAIDEARVQFERFDGRMSPEIVRLSLERGDSVAAIVHDPKKDTLMFTEQFRYPTCEKGPGWLLEVPAGMVDAGEVPADAMRREIAEETGYAVDHIEPIATFYVSPGGSSERIFLYYATVTARKKASKGGGLDSEHEDIRVAAMSVDEALAKVRDGTIQDAKTIIGLQWLQLKRPGPASKPAKPSKRKSPTRQERPRKRK